MPLRVRWKNRTLTQCSRGVTTVEFAFIAPIAILIMMGVIEFSLIMFTMSVMESATSNTSRMGKTGYSAPGVTRQQQIINNITSRTAGLLNPALIIITTTVYPSFDKVGDPEPYVDSNNNGVYNAGEAFTDSNGNGQWDSDMGSAGLGNGGDVVVYTVTYPWHISTPLVAAITGQPFNITVRSVVKNEPF